MSRLRLTVVALMLAMLTVTAHSLSDGVLVNGRLIPPIKLLLLDEDDATAPGTSPKLSEFIVVDQFGYKPEMNKIAVIRDPATGFDAAKSYAPGTVFRLINSATGNTVFSGAPVPWNSGATDASSGDRAWRFDFSTYDVAGRYFVLDVQNLRRSAVFEIADNVYDTVLREALRTFFYQRAGVSKQLPHAAPGWVDAASHIGSGQDTEARRFDAQNNASTERDLSGGWYDAGDYNKYTNWTADYVTNLLTAYLERPTIWADDFNIPESGNGVPDILDEAKVGLDWLVKMQNSNGSVLSIVGVAHASPPSAAIGPSYYGPENTSATLTTAGAFALASTIYGSLGNAGLSSYADDLLARAEDAWDWADANPNVIFRNNDAAYNSVGLGAGQQEVDATVRAEKKLSAAIYLADATDKSVYKNYVTANYQSSKLVGSYFINAFESRSQRDLLYYAASSVADTNAANTIRDRYRNAMESPEHWGAVDDDIDPYRAHLAVYTWGSNSIKSREGSLFMQQAQYGIGSRTAAAANNAAAGYIHYLHGVNPLGLVYLTNMKSFAAEKSLDTIYHTWFADGNSLFDSVNTSVYGPAPGFLAGGPNPSYTWDSCCPNSCGSTANNAICGAAPLSPPAGQPPQKAYLEFNDSWPLNSWQVTENSNSYQVAYIRLLSKFVD